MIEKKAEKNKQSFNELYYNFKQTNICVILTEFSLN